MTVNPRLLERRRTAALIEGFGSVTAEYIQLLRFRIMELEDEIEALKYEMEKHK
jgi:hypothetical protein